MARKEVAYVNLLTFRSYIDKIWVENMDDNEATSYLATTNYIDPATTNYNVFTTGDTKRYDQMGIQIPASKAIVFELDASNDAHLGFFTASRSLDEMYEIVISGWGNTKSVIRRRNQGPEKTDRASTKGLLSSGSYTHLWADAKGGVVRFGRGDVVGQDVILQWNDPHPLNVTSVGMMTGWGSSGKWIFRSSPSNTFSLDDTPFFLRDHHDHGPLEIFLGEFGYKAETIRAYCKRRAAENRNGACSRGDLLDAVKKLQKQIDLLMSKL